jgi:hypothetical protein
VLLALDLDGVLCDLGPGLATRIEHEFGVVTHPATWWTYDLGHLDLPAPVVRRFLDGAFADPSLYADAPACEGAVWGVEQLRLAGWDLIGVTARSDHLTDVTREWLDKRGLGLDEVVHASFLAKSEVARVRGAAAAIEDHPEEAERLGGVCDAWLMDRPYNASHRPIRCRRLKTWDDAVGRLCQLQFFAS